MADWNVDTDWNVRSSWDTESKKKAPTENAGDSSGEFSERLIRLNEKNLAIHTEKVRNLCDFTPLPKPGEQYVMVTDKSYNALTFIDFIIRSERPLLITMAVYRINMFAVQRLTELLDAYQELRISVAVSNFFNSNARAEKWAEHLKDLSENHERMTAAFIPSHAKVFCCLTESGRHFVFEGSGNLSDNARIEQYRYEDNEEVYDFHTKWINETIAKNL